MFKPPRAVFLPVLVPARHPPVTARLLLCRTLTVVVPRPVAGLPGNTSVVIRKVRPNLLSFRLQARVIPNTLRRSSRRGRAPTTLPVLLRPNLCMAHVIAQLERCKVGQYLPSKKWHALGFIRWVTCPLPVLTLPLLKLTTRRTLLPRGSVEPATNPWNFV